MIEKTIANLLDLDGGAVTHRLIGGSTAVMDVADLKTIAKYYDDNVLAPQRALAKFQVHLDWAKTLERDPTTKMPICNCGSVIPESYFNPEKRDHFLKWCEEHYPHKDVNARKLNLVKSCPFVDILNSECVLPLDHDGDHQMVNGTNDANDQKKDAHPAEEFIASYHDLRKYVSQFEEVYNRAFESYSRARDLLEGCEAKMKINAPGDVEVKNAVFGSTAFPHGWRNEN